LTGRRDDYVLATKCVGPTGPRPWDRGASRRHIIAETPLDADLKADLDELTAVYRQGDAAR
jgi:aryl-alcohol dehydrogenase-like predicted oxidoreductase